MYSIAKIIKKTNTMSALCLRSLPKAQREAVYTLFAFCNHLDYVLHGKVSDKKELLDMWELELQNIYEKKVPQSNIGRKIYKNCMRFKVRQEDFHKILKAAFLDFETPIQAPNTQLFEQYCAGVYEIPIYITLQIMGQTDEDFMRRLSKSFGVAVALTDILKNLKEDALAGYMYIPESFLQNAQVPISSPLSVVTHKNIVSVREAMAKEAFANFKNAFELLKTLDKKKTRILRFVLCLYERTYSLMAARGWEIISPTLKVKRINRLRILFQILFDKF